MIGASAPPDPRPRPHARDLLDEGSDTRNLRGVLSFRTDFTGPRASAGLSSGTPPRVHLVLSRACSLAIETGRRRTHGPGELVTVPRRRSHIFADRPGRPTDTLATVLRGAGFRGRRVLKLGAGDPEAASRRVCGHPSSRPGARASTRCRTPSSSPAGRGAARPGSTTFAAAWARAL